MKSILYALSGLVIAVIILLSSAKPSFASEGQFSLTNRVGEESRCWAASVLMQNQEYQILLSCRDISYPGGTSVFYYVIWATPSEGGNPVRLGTVGLGKGQYETKTAFSTLYITKETSDNPRTPTGQIIMQGSLQNIDLLDRPSQAPPINDDNSELSSSPTPTSTASSAPRNLGRIFAAGGILAFIAIFGVIIVVFVVTRK